MKIPYHPLELDRVIRAALEFKEIAPDEYFSVVNISGRQGLSSSTNDTKKMLKFIVQSDLQLLEYSGFGNDNIEYFDLGPQAGAFLEKGGFENLVKREKRQEAFQRVRDWSPIVISVMALIISTLNWIFPAEQKSETKQLNALVERLWEKQNDQGKELRKLQTAILQKDLRTTNDGLSKPLRQR